MLNIEIKGTDELIRALRGGVAALQRDLGTAVYQGAQAIRSTVVRKLKGPVLNVQSGRLWRSVQARKAGPNAAVVGTDVEYAAIHEFGGTIPEHMVLPKVMSIGRGPVPKNAPSVLSWVQDGQRRFSRGHMIPDVTMPARPYMGPSAEENEGKITELVHGVIERGLRRGGT